MGHEASQRWCRCWLKMTATEKQNHHQDLLMLSSQMRSEEQRTFCLCHLSSPICLTHQLQETPLLPSTHVYTHTILFLTLLWWLPSNGPYLPLEEVAHYRKAIDLSSWLWAICCANDQGNSTDYRVCEDILSILTAVVQRRLFMDHACWSRCHPNKTVYGYAQKGTSEWMRQKSSLIGRKTD